MDLEHPKDLAWEVFGEGRMGCAGRWDELMDLSPSAFPSPGQLASSMQTGLGIAVTFFSQRFGGMGRGWGACLLRCAT